jgi:pimeloyl-ACP methyl ester carboxylesterase
MSCAVRGHAVCGRAASKRAHRISPRPSRRGARSQNLAGYADVLRDPARARASSACYRTFLTRELPALAARGDRSSELQVPTLLAMGAQSAIRLVLDPRPSRNLHVETIPRAGHFLPEEAPGEVLRLARSWLRQV